MSNPLGVKQGEEFGKPIAIKLMLYGYMVKAYDGTTFAYCEENHYFYCVESGHNRDVNELEPGAWTLVDYYKSPPEKQTVEDEVKAAEWWRDGWVFMTLMSWSKSSPPYFSEDNDVSYPVFNTDKHFVAYVVRLGDGAVRMVEATNVWTEEGFGAYRLYPRRAGSYKAELLGVLVEKSE